MWYLYGFALLAGIANAIEPGQNATLAKSLGNPFLSGIVCFALGILILMAGLIAVGRLDLPGGGRVAEVPWWAWPGGVLGAAVVLAQLTVSEQIGAAPFLGCLVTAGVLGSILLDHYGLVGFACQPASRWRIAGGALMVVGVTLVALF